MSHLEMRYNEPLPHRPYLLPEGYRLVTVETDADKLGWIEACAEGLSTGAWTVKDFEKNMLEPEGLAKDQIFLVKDAAGRVVAPLAGLGLHQPGLNLETVATFTWLPPSPRPADLGLAACSHSMCSIFSWRAASIISRLTQTISGSRLLKRTCGLDLFLYSANMAQNSFGETFL